MLDDKNRDSVSSTICLRLLNIFIASGLYPATGSSSSSNLGSPIIERPMSTSFDWPPESSLASYEPCVELLIVPRHHMREQDVLPQQTKIIAEWTQMD